MLELPQTYRAILDRLLEANPPDGEFVAQYAMGGGGGRKLQPKGAGGRDDRPEAIPVSDSALAEMFRLQLLQWQVPDRAGYVTEAGKQALAQVRDAGRGLVADARGPEQVTRVDGLLIRDQQLRERCRDLLAAGGHYDRVIREACVILEDRVRQVSGADRTDVGPGLMAKAFRPEGGLLKLSAVIAEQTGAMELYRGTMGFFRNDAGHHVVDTWTRDDALKFVGWIDLLLSMLEQSTKPSPPAATT